VKWLKASIMKLSLVVLFAVVAVVFSAPSSDESEENVIVVDDAKKLSNFIDFVRNEIKGEKMKEKVFYPILLNSVDQSCMLTQYQKFGLVEMIPDSPQNNRHTRFSDEQMFIAANIAAMCSSKNYDILDFIFENLWTSKILLKAFINEPELKDIKDMMTCANNYAVTNGIIDPAVNPIKHELAHDLEDKCEELTTIAKVAISGFKLKVREASKRVCSFKIVDDLEKFVLKNVLLLQVDMTEGQKNVMKKNFVKDVRLIMEKMLTCAAKEPTEMLRDF
jgi:hypothetical protein